MSLAVAKSIHSVDSTAISLPILLPTLQPTRKRTSTVDGPDGQPRRKLLKRERLTLEVVSQFFHLPIREAAAKLGVSVTYVKSACRSHGISKWPYRKLRADGLLLQQSDAGEGDGAGESMRVQQTETPLDSPWDSVGGNTLDSLFSLPHSTACVAENTISKQEQQAQQVCKMVDTYNLGSLDFLDNELMLPQPPKAAPKCEVKKEQAPSVQCLTAEKQMQMIDMLNRQLAMEDQQSHKQHAKAPPTELAPPPSAESALALVASVMQLRQREKEVEALRAALSMHAQQVQVGVLQSSWTPMLAASLMGRAPSRAPDWSDSATLLVALANGAKSGLF